MTVIFDAILNVSALSNFIGYRVAADCFPDYRRLAGAVERCATVMAMGLAPTIPRAVVMPIEALRTANPESHDILDHDFFRR
jgi:hypothetical protein